MPLMLSATLLADEPTPRTVDENMSVALMAAVVVADFPVHPPGPPIVFAVAVTHDYIFGHGSGSVSVRVPRHARRAIISIHT